MLPHACDARTRAGVFGSGMRRRIVRGSGISAAGNNEVMGGGCEELDGVQTKKGAGVGHVVFSSSCATPNGRPLIGTAEISKAMNEASTAFPDESFRILDEISSRGRW